MKTLAVTKGALAGTNKGKTAIKEGKNFDLFLNGQFIGTKILKWNTSLHRGEKEEE